MKRTLMIEIDCGDKTCADSPKRFCHHVLTSRLGTKFECQLFNVELVNKDGWLQRCPSCLAHDHDDAQPRAV